MKEKNKEDRRSTMLVVPLMLVFLVICIIALSWLDSICQRRAKKNNELASTQTTHEKQSAQGDNAKGGNEQGENANVGNGQNEHPDTGNGQNENPDTGNGQNENPDTGNGQNENAGGHQESEAVKTPDTGMGKQESYQVISGKITEVEISLDWDDFECEKVLNAEEPAVIELSDKTVVELNGTMALGKGPREYGIVEGGAKFEVVEAEMPFTMVNSVGVLTVDTADFEVELDDILTEDEEAQPGDSGKEMKLKVLTGKVKVQRQDFHKVELVSAGEEKIFRLEAVKRNGEITVMGFGLANPKFKGPRAKIMKKRGAKMDAERCLAQFSGGMHFVTEPKEDGYAFKEATFMTRETVSVFSDECDYSDLTDEVLMCTVVKKLPRENAVARRNMPLIEGFGGTPVEMHKSLPMAIESARSNATLHAIRKAAGEVYGEPIPDILTGTFYPEYLSIDCQDDQIVATVKGQVVFE